MGQVLRSQHAAAEYVAEVGGLPEIDRASTDLVTAINHTRGEILEAQIARRFPRDTSDIFDSTTASLPIAAGALWAIEKEGEAGMKRYQLLCDLEVVEDQLASLIGRLVHIRADLHAASTEFDDQVDADSID